LGSLPLIAWYFHLATPVNLLANLVVVPLSSLALMSNLGALVCGPWLPYFTEWFNHSAWLWMKCMVGVSEWAARLPGAFRAVPTPAPWFCALYYGVLLGAFRGWFWQPRYRRWAAAILLLGVGLCVGPWISTRHELRFTVLALDHGGSAAFLDAPGRHRDLLIDTGRDSDAQRIVKPFLMAQGVNQLARLVLTHGDIGHLGGAELIRAELGASQVITSTVRYRSPVYRALTNQLVQTPGQWLRVQRGDQVAGWRVLHPPTGARLPRADDLPLVLLVEWQGNRLLLLSDLSPEGQAELLKGNEDLHADLVVSSLPLQGEPLGEVLLEAIRPRAMIVNDALYRPNERARLALRERLARRRVPVLYTSEVGAVTVLLDRGGWQLGSMRGPTVRSDRPKPAWQAAEYPPLGPPLDDGTPDEDAPEEPPQS
jgi:competence protein ComEC